MNNRARIKTSIRQKITLIISGIVIFFVFLEAGLRLGGFILLSLQERANLESVKQKSDYRIMCLGESTTAGQYPLFLEETLNQRNIGIKFSVIDKGRIGVNTSRILSDLEENLDKYNPDMVVVMMGINEGDTIAVRYGKNFFDKINLSVGSLKVYKLAKLLKLHILSKIENKPLYGSMNVSGPAKISEPKKRELRNDAMLVGLAWSYRTQGRLTRAREFFYKALELNPRNDQAYEGLGWCYRDSFEVFRAEECFMKAVELNPRNDRAYAGLGWCYRDSQKHIRAEECFKKALELDPRNDNAYKGLGWCYRDKGEFIEAINSFEKVVELAPRDDHAYSVLAELYGRTGRKDFAKKYHAKSIQLRSEYYKPLLNSNYLRLKDILDKRRIKLVCVQYPARSIKPLKKIFKEQEGVIFVDNEMVFKKALANGTYREYFTDSFAGDFGHCTSKGNRLLAGNIADVILKEIFGR